MFPSGTPFVTQLVIYGVLLAFDFGAAVSVYSFARRAIGKRLVERSGATSHSAR